jgi:hypothetical protein
VYLHKVSRQGKALEDGGSLVTTKTLVTEYLHDRHGELLQVLES